MITRIDATNYRCFERLGVPLSEFCVIAGANGSGKTTVLDIPVLLGDLLRSRNVAGAFMDRLLGRGARATALGEIPFRLQRESFSVGIEARLPDDIKKALVDASLVAVRRDPAKWPTHIRYELRLQVDDAHQLLVQNEYLFVFPHSEEYESKRLPMQGENADQQDWRFIIRRAYGSEAALRDERRGAKERTARVDDTLTAFARLQFESDAEFSASRWLLGLLLDGVLFFDPKWRELRKASPPGLAKTLMGSGENLPWLALRLQTEDPDRFAAWVAHVRTALPQIVAISMREREEDHHVYFRVQYEGGYEVTSSGLSEGTLRILALTLVAYIDDVPRLLVVEEPENSIHPQAIDTIMQSLRSLYDRQVWVSTHSPVVLASSEVSELLVARLERSGAASVIPGSEHPRLAEWKGAIDLGSLFATGVFE
jgi:energy-coupling factor transporter ATP-binding protein EcfA2